MERSAASPGRHAPYRFEVMKTDFSQLPREEIEARITTMLLGEMPADEAAELMEFVSRDSELLKLHDELKRTISLVTEAAAGDEAMKLSEGRREQLLESFKMVKPPELAEKTHGKIEWRNWAAMAAMVGLLLGGAAFVLNVPRSTELARTGSGEAYRTARLLQEESAAAFREQLSKNPEWVGVLERDGKVSITGQVPPGMFPATGEKERFNDRDVRRAPQKPPVNGPVGATRGRSKVQADAALPLPKSKLTAAMDESVEANLKSVAPTKIELPVAQSDAPTQTKSEAWNFQAGQGRGFGGYGGGRSVDNRGDAERGLRYADVEGKVEATPLSAETPPSAASSFIAGKNAMLAYDAATTPPELQTRQSGAVETTHPTTIGLDARFGNESVADAKKDEVPIDALKRLPTGSITTSGAIDPLTGLPTVTGAAQPEFAERDAKNSGGE
jgi:hypothetical protein